MHVHTVTHIFKQSTHQTASHTLEMWCSVWIYNWNDMIWVQKNVEVIAQSDNMGLAVWARARVRAGQAGCREHCHAFPESGSELHSAVKGF